MIVAQIGVLSREANRLGRGEAVLEAPDPRLARRADQLVDEFACGERQDDIDGDALSEQRLGEHDVRAGGE